MLHIPPSASQPHAKNTVQADCQLVADTLLNKIDQDEKPKTGLMEPTVRSFQFNFFCFCYVCSAKVQRRQYLPDLDGVETDKAC